MKNHTQDIAQSLSIYSSNYLQSQLRTMSPIEQQLTAAASNAETMASVRESVDYIYSSIRRLKQLDNLEYYTIPVCFVLGILGNIIGSLCLLSAHKMRKRTPLFLLASIGFADSFFLGTQLHRWSMIYYQDKTLDFTTIGLCQFYFMFIKASILLSLSIMFALVATRFIRFFMGSYHLSIYSNVGQICSRLSVAYTFALVLSASWHGLYTSGPYLRNDTELYLPNKIASAHNYPFKEKIFNCSSTWSVANDNASYPRIICKKNVEDIEVVDFLNYFHFSICLFIYVLLVLASLLVLIKMKQNSFKRLFSLCCCCCLKRRFSIYGEADNFMINGVDGDNDNYIQDYVLKNAPEFSRTHVNRNAASASKNNSSNVINEDGGDHQTGANNKASRVDEPSPSAQVSSNVASGINNAITTRVMSANKMDDLLKKLNKIEAGSKTASLGSLINANYERTSQLGFELPNGEIRGQLMARTAEESRATPVRNWSNHVLSNEVANVTLMTGRPTDNSGSSVRIELNNNAVQTPPFNSSNYTHQLSNAGDSSCWYERDYSSFNKIEHSQQRPAASVVKKRPPPPRKFTCYLILLSLVNAMFGVPYIFFDTFFYSDADITPLFNVDSHFLNFYEFLDAHSIMVNFDLIKLAKYLRSETDFASNSTSLADESFFLSNNSTALSWIKNEIDRQFAAESCYITTLLISAWIRLPLILINIPHALKFYLLFLFYSKFRHRVSVFLHLRFYINNRMLKQMYVQLYENFNRGEEACRRSSRERSQSAAYNKSRNDCRLFYKEEGSTSTRKDSEPEKSWLKKSSKGSIGVPGAHGSRKDEPSGHFNSQEIIFEFKNDKKRPSNKSGELGSVKLATNEDNQSKKSFKKTFSISNKRFESVFLLHGCNPFKKAASNKSNESSQDRELIAGGGSKNSSIVKRVKRLKFGGKGKTKSPVNSDEANNSHVSINSNITENQILTPKASFKSKKNYRVDVDAVLTNPNGGGGNSGVVEPDVNSDSPKSKRGQSLSDRIKKRSIKLLNNSKFLFITPVEGADEANKNGASEAGEDAAKTAGSNEISSKPSEPCTSQPNASMVSIERRLKKLSYNDKISKMLVEFESDDDDEPSSIVGFQSYSNSLNDLPVIQHSSSISNQMTSTVRHNSRFSKQSVSMPANSFTLNNNS